MIVSERLRAESVKPSDCAKLIYLLKCLANWVCFAHRITAYCIWSGISSFIWDHIHMGSHSYGITFIWDHIHMGSHSYRLTAYCIWSGISSISNLNRWSSSLGLFYHVPLKRDQGDWDWKTKCHSKCNRLCTHISTHTHISIHTYPWRLFPKDLVLNM